MSLINILTAIHRATGWTPDVAIKKQCRELIGYYKAATRAWPDPISQLGEESIANNRAVTVIDCVPPADQLGPSRYSEGFRSVHWYGTDFTFTDTQGACVAMLWVAWKNGTPEIGQGSILEAPTVEAESKRLADVFKAHPAWGKMIVPGNTRGAYRLAAPEAKA